MKKKNTLIAGAVLTLVILFVGCVQDKKDSLNIEQLRTKQTKIKDMFGVNGFEWDFYDSKYSFDTTKFNLIKNFSGFRHFLDWDRIEPEKDVFRFNHKPEGGWSYDEVYQKCHQDSILVLVDLQTTASWLVNTYPANKRQRDVIPIAYGANRSQPSSYIEIAKAGFQFAARYGTNSKIDKSLIKVPKEAEHPVIGLGYVQYIESGNEPDKWWKGKESEESPEEHAAQLSAFYDGHKGTLGKGVGVKTADPNMKVVMGGIAKPNVEFVARMVEWCKQNRGYKKDGSIDLCFDVINYHMYSNDYTGWFAKFKSKKRGVAPETNDMTKIANTFTDLRSKLGINIPIWSTETGYDLSDKSVQRAIAIGAKTQEITQADWLIRLGLLYARLGIDRVFYYQLYDNNDPGTDNGTPFGFSGLVEKNGKRRAAADYIHQITALMGDYYYFNTINQDPIVDVYQKGKKRMFILVVPDEIDRKEKYQLDLNQAKTAIVHRLKPGFNQMTSEEVNTNNGILEIEVTETPVFVEAK
ncbi:hypothetical protein [Pedobacter sp.]|jgi:hypothetical protein|uniref:hypothetical protein n=1 Tax=Pedobacter sp. TaxID=1411316 RepID=UPI002B71ECEC|nr:hypothetical protein [Pedobacter sp.]HWW42409.1 hypothetical protein [Pedobacter sp.]